MKYTKFVYELAIKILNDPPAADPTHFVRTPT